MSKKYSLREKIYYTSQLKRIVEILEISEDNRKIVFGTEISRLASRLYKIIQPKLKEHDSKLLQQFVELKKQKNITVLMTYAGRLEKLNPRSLNVMLSLQKKANSYMDKHEDVRYIDLNK